MLTLDHDVDGRIAHVSVRGDLDLYTAPQLTEKLEGLPVGELDQIVLDLSEVEFIDSSGLSILLRARDTLSPTDGTLVLRHPSRVVHRLLEVAGLTKHFTIVTPGDGEPAETPPA